MSIIMFWVVFALCMYGALSSFLEYRNSKNRKQLGWSIGWLVLCVLNIVIELI